MLKNKWEIFIGCCLALILQTQYRFIGNAIGVGEIGLVFFIVYTAFLYILHWPKIDIIRRYALPWWLLVYLCAALLPVTALYVMFEKPGTDFRDFAAYLLSIAFIISLAIHRSDIKTVTYSTIVFTLILITFQYFFGGDNAWYSMRFTGGAKNPNQLGLYMACCLLLVITFIKKYFIKIPFITAFLFFGIASYSDAFMAYMVITLITLILAIVIPKKYFLFSIIPIFAIFLIIIGYFSSELTHWLGQKWAEADQGGSRLTLYFNGLLAWLDSLFTILLGNGAGSFSGITGPFQSSEAHNTPIDILAMGGLLGFFCFYFFPIKYAIATYILNQKIVFSCAVGLICFSLFHFVARHPIFWFTIFALSEFIWMHKKKGTQ